MTYPVMRFRLFGVAFIDDPNYPRFSIGQLLPHLCDLLPLTIHYVHDDPACVSNLDGKYV